MYEYFFENFTYWQICALCTCAFLAGVNKTGMPGASIIIVPLMASSFPARESTGLVLPVLAMADIFAVSYYRKHARWNIIFKLLPWTFAGLGMGSLIIRHVDNKQLEPLIGGIVLTMLIISWIRNRRGGSMNIPTHPAFAAVMGFAAGVSSQMANAAGPIMLIYMLAMQLSKEEYIGTGAWFFLIVNWTKMPLYIWEGRITMDSVRADMPMLPVIALGAFAGIIILKKMSQKWFNIIIQILALAATLNLCYSARKLF